MRKERLGNIEPAINEEGFDDRGKEFVGAREFNEEAGGIGVAAGGEVGVGKGSEDGGSGREAVAAAHEGEDDFGDAELPAAGEEGN